MTELKRSAEQISQLNRILRAIRNVNQLIVREKDPARLVQQTCELLVESGGYISAWIALGDGRDPPASVAQAGWGRAFEPFAASLREGRWPLCWHECVAREDVATMCDPAAACEGCSLSDGYGDRVAQATALRHDGKVLGQLGVSIPGGSAADDEERTLLAEVAADVAFALHTIEMERLQRESEERFKVITESSPDAIFLADRMGNYTYVNEAAAQLLGYSTDELLKMSIVDLAVKARVQDYLQTFQELLVKGRLFVELELVRKNGTVVPVDLNAVLLPTGETYGSCRDLTTRKQAEEALRRGEEQLKLAQQVAHIGHWELDAYDGTPVWSDEVFRLFGLEPGVAEPSFTSHDTVIHPEEWPLLDQAVRAGFENGEPFNLVFRILRPDHPPGWMQAIGTAKRDDHGKVVKMFGTAQDITDREQARRELVAGEERFRLVFDATTDGILLVDEATQKLVLGNKAFCKLLGYTPEELTELTVADIYPSEVWSELEVAFARQAEGASNLGEAIAVKRKDGAIFHADIGGAGMMYDGRRVFVASFRDVTEKRNLQAQLAQADRLSSMGMLAAGVAHEINNPLSYVLFNLESLSEILPDRFDVMRRIRARLDNVVDPAILEDVVGDSGQKLNAAALDDILARLKDALGGTRRICEITRSLGTFSRVEQNQLVPVNLEHVIDAALDMAYNEIKYRARLVRDLASTPTVLASEGRLSQVFLNLIINAAHAITEGDVENNEIRVRTWVEGDEVCAEVRDTGSGIAPEHIRKIFEPFFTTKKIGVGSGLGLAISKSIVEGFHGTIQVSSEVGKGTSFIIRLPAGQERAAALDAPPAATAAPRIGGRILIIDDDPAIRFAMSDVLSDYETVEASSGAEAMKMLESDQAFDLILCDMMMPDITGMALHKWLAERQPQLAEQVIFVTGGAFTPQARDYLSKLDNLIVEKPIGVADLKKIVGDHISTPKDINPR